jgi:RNA polymerase sigma-70 factor, ECF subfamily
VNTLQIRKVEMGKTPQQTSGPAQAGQEGGDDAGLIAASLSAPECFGPLFDRHAPAIHRYIARRLGPDAADDLVAETFLAAFRRRACYDPAHADARPWLYGIATRLIGRHRRDEVRFFRAIARTGVDPAAEPVADRVTDRIAAQAASRELAAAVAKLPQAQRDVLLLVASGLGYQEVAVALAVPAGTVSSRLVRARRKVREALGGQDPSIARKDSPE